MHAKWIVKAFITLVVLFLLFILIGALAPIQYTGSVSERMVDRPQDVWNNLTAVHLIPERKRDVASVDILGEDRGLVTWRENLRNGGYRLYGMQERVAPLFLAVRLFESSNGVTGTWTYTLKRFENQTNIIITEDSLNESIWLRAWYTIRGRNILLKNELKSLRVSLFQRLLTTD